jgi:drug/metabolite transporter (DMT)-like permease
MSQGPKATFSKDDIRALRYLAVVLGLIGVGLIWKSGTDHSILAVGFIVVVMATVVVTIYGLRRFRSRQHPVPPSDPAQRARG